jgi:hypothetical protein
MLSFELDCGRSVYLSRIEYNRTYGGLYAGSPNEKYNNTLIENARSRTHRPAFVVPPKIDNSEPEHPTLPPIEMIAEVWCNDPISPEWMGSHLAIIWYREAWENESLREVVQDGIGGVDWDNVAVDFDW